MDTVELLAAGLLLMALVAVACLVWALKQSGRLSGRPVPKSYDVHVEGTKLFSDTDLAHVEQSAEQQLQAVVQESAGRLQESLNSSIDQMAKQITDMAQSTVSQEFEKYRVTLEVLQSQSVEEFGKLEKELEDKRGAMLESMEKEVAEERQKQMDRFNLRLNDVMSSYLAESLGNNVDLGAQSVYIMQMLEQHKDEIKRDVLA